jgi:hypothetical protein
MDARSDANACCDDWHHSVTSARVDLRIDDNSTWMDAFQFGEPDDTTWTLTGQSFELDVQRTPYDAVPLLHLDTAGGRIFIDDVVQRVIHFNVSPDVIQTALRPGEYVYDLVMLDGSTPPVRVALMHGSLFVSRGVTFPPP